MASSRTTLERKSPELRRLVRALGLTTRFHRAEYSFEYRCSAHHQWHSFAYTADEQGVKQALATLREMENARQLWGSRVDRVRELLSLMVRRLDRGASEALAEETHESPSGDELTVLRSGSVLECRLCLVGEAPLLVQSATQHYEHLLEACIARWGSDVVPWSGFGNHGTVCKEKH